MELMNAFLTGNNSPHGNVRTKTDLKVLRVQLASSFQLYVCGQQPYFERKMEPER